MRPDRDESDTAAELELHRAHLVRFCRGYLRSAEDAEEAAAETIARALSKDPRPVELRPWLLRSARNRCLNLLRAEAARGHVQPLESELALAASLTGALTRLARQEERERLAALLERLSADERELLRLRYVDELSREEIAALVGLALSVVKSRLFEALEKLRRQAGGDGLTQGEP